MCGDLHLQRGRAFPNESGLGAAKVQQQHVADTVAEVDGHGMRCGRVVGVKHVPLDPVEQHHDLIVAADIDVVMQLPFVAEFHADSRCEVERGVSAKEAPSANEPK